MVILAPPILLPFFGDDAMDKNILGECFLLRQPSTNDEDIQLSRNQRVLFNQ